MKPNPFFQRSSFWALALALGVGVFSVAGLRGAPGISKAYADPIAGGSIAPETARDMLRAMDTALAKLAQSVEPAVVHIEVGSNGSSADGMAGVHGEGSGVIYREDGYIITNDHVVNGMDSVKVTLTDGRELKGTVIRSDDAGDIAVVKVDAHDLPTLKFADSNDVRPGITAMAVGSPFGLENSVTIGHVSALDRKQFISDPRFPGGERFYADLIQTDAAINMGNSGGALVDVDGRLIGINTAIASSTGGSNGIGFAVPSKQAQLIADMLIKDGKVTRAYLGLEPVALKDVQKKELGVDEGAYVNRVEPKTPADSAGIKVGDVVTKIADTPIHTYMDLRNAMYRYKPGTSVKVEYVRDKQKKSTDVALRVAPKLNATPQRMTPFQRGFRSPFPDNPSPFNSRPFGNTPFGDDPFGDSLPSPNGRNPERSDQATPKRTGAAHLGAMVSPLTKDLRAQFHVPADKNGAMVASTEPGSVAERLGMHAGDVITEFNGKAINSADDLLAGLKSVKWGDKATISFSRWSDANSVSSMTESFTF
jgi:serine protease Do